MRKIAVLLFCLAATSVSVAAPANDSERVVRTATFPQTQGTVVVVEGDFEPRSIGSYTLRLYAKNDPAFPYDSFLTGTVRPRDGSIESVRFADLDRDGAPEIIVVTRSAGSGGYLSADAFRFHGQSLTFLTAVSGIEGNADPVHALAARIEKH